MSDLKRVKGRKRHKCNFCGGDIVVGEVHQTITCGPWNCAENETVSTVRAHLSCYKHREFFYDESDCCSYYDNCYSEFNEYVKNKADN